jgi:hypothetical protein
MTRTLWLSIVLVGALAAGLVASSACWSRPAFAEDVGAGALLVQARDAYKNRHVAGNGRKAVALYEQVIGSAPSFEAYWEGARAVWFEGDVAMKRSPGSKRAAYFSKGIGWARSAVALRPERAEGHLWLGILLGLSATSSNVFHQISVVREIRQSAERAVKLDRAVECGAALNLLGSFYLELPGALGGSAEKAVKLLDEAVKTCPIDPSHHLALSKALDEVGQGSRSRQELEWILAHSPPEPGWGPEYKVAQDEARELLEGRE